ncbi:MAG: sensor histidine kinase, partial [Tepidiformaceae bacterium]
MDDAFSDPVALVVHELRSPLGYMATAAHLLAEESAEADVRTRCDVIERTARRMLRVTESVLEAAGVLASNVRPQRYSPAEVAAQVVDDARGLGIDIELAVQHPAASGVAWGVSAQLETLLQSLLNNALDHGGGGTVL